MMTRAGPLFWSEAARRRRRQQGGGRGAQNAAGGTPWDRRALALATLYFVALQFFCCCARCGRNACACSQQKTTTLLQASLPPLVISHRAVLHLYRHELLLEASSLHVHFLEDSLVSWKSSGRAHQGKTSGSNTERGIELSRQAGRRQAQATKKIWTWTQ